MQLFSLKNFAGAAVAALAIGAATAAHASTLDPLTYLNDSDSFSGQGSATYDFTVTPGNVLTEINVITNPKNLSVSYSLYEGPTWVASDFATGANAYIDDFFNLASGTYALTVNESVSSGNATFGGTVSAVPLPAALPLFGTVLAGVGFFGRRRRAKTAAV